MKKQGCGLIIRLIKKEFRSIIINIELSNSLFNIYVTLELGETETYSGKFQFSLLFVQTNASG